MTNGLKGILLVEDDPNDVFFMERALSKAGLDRPVHVSTNGLDAIDYLAAAGKYYDRGTCPLPQWIFLDLKLPILDGFEVLEWLGKEPSLSQIGVFVLTASDRDQDRQRATRLGANAYLVKPPSHEMLLEVLQSRGGFLAACAA